MELESFQIELESSLIELEISVIHHNYAFGELSNWINWIRELPRWIKELSN